MAEEIKEKIYQFLKEKKPKRFNMKVLVEESGVASRATVLKWVQVLIAEKRIFVADYGNVKLVWIE